MRITQRALTIHDLLIVNQHQKMGSVEIADFNRILLPTKHRYFLRTIRGSYLPLDRMDRAGSTFSTS